MKKILLGTTTLIGAAALFSGAAMADTPKVTLGGFEDFQVGIANQDLDTNQRNHAFRSDTEVTLRIDGVMDNGLKYGGGINLEADVDGEGSNQSGASGSGFDNLNQGFNASQTYIYTEGMWGRVEMGSRVGVTNTMKVDASSIARATGGIDGDWRLFTNPTTGGGARYLATPDLVLDSGLLGGAAANSAAQQYGDKSTGNNNKVTYYTPRFSGFQAGVSYIVSSDGARGQQVTLSNNSGGQAENIFAGGLNWEGKFDQVGIMVAATGEWGNSQSNATEDLRAWNAGAKVTYMGFALAGSYGSWGDSLRATGGGLDSSWYWTAGASYETGPFGISVTYLKSQFDEGASSDDFHNVSVGVDYKMAPGFTPYAEVSFINADPAAGTSVNENQATIFIAGTQLTF